MNKNQFLKVRTRINDIVNHIIIEDRINYDDNYSIPWKRKKLWDETYRREIDRIRNELEEKREQELIEHDRMEGDKYIKSVEEEIDAGQNVSNPDPLRSWRNSILAKIADGATQDYTVVTVEQLKQYAKYILKHPDEHRQWRERGIYLEFIESADAFNKVVLSLYEQDGRKNLRKKVLQLQQPKKDKGKKEGEKVKLGLFASLVTLFGAAIASMAMPELSQNFFDSSNNIMQAMVVAGVMPAPKKVSKDLTIRSPEIVSLIGLVLSFKMVGIPFVGVVFVGLFGILARKWIFHTFGRGLLFALNNLPWRITVEEIIIRIRTVALTYLNRFNTEWGRVFREMRSRFISGLSEFWSLSTVAGSKDSKQEIGGDPFSIPATWNQKGYIIPTKLKILALVSLIIYFAFAAPYLAIGFSLLWVILTFYRSFSIRKNMKLAEKRAIRLDKALRERIATFQGRGLALIKTGNLRIKGLTRELWITINQGLKYHHMAQKRSDGTDHRAHTLEVMAILVYEMNIKDIEYLLNIIIAADLHDFLEDSTDLFLNALPHQERKRILKYHKDRVLGQFAKEIDLLRTKKPVEKNQSEENLRFIEAKSKRELREFNLDLELIFTILRALMKTPAKKLNLPKFYYSPMVNLKMRPLMPFEKHFIRSYSEKERLKVSFYTMLIKIADRIQNLRSEKYNPNVPLIWAYLQNTMEDFLEAPMEGTGKSFVDSLPKEFNSVKVLFRKTVLQTILDNFDKLAKESPDEFLDKEKAILLVSRIDRTIKIDERHTASAKGVFQHALRTLESPKHHSSALRILPFFMGVSFLSFLPDSAPAFFGQNLMSISVGGAFLVILTLGSLFFIMRKRIEIQDGQSKIRENISDNLIDRFIEELKQIEELRDEIAGGVLFFLSARWKSEHAERLSYKIGEIKEPVKEKTGKEIAVVTGGGPNGMEDANRGAKKAGVISVGLTVSDLPFEQTGNSSITRELPSKYFATRLPNFESLAIAILSFIGGFGSLNEGFMTLKNKELGVTLKDMPNIMIGKMYHRFKNLLEDSHQKGLIQDPIDELLEVVDEEEINDEEILDKILNSPALLDRLSRPKTDTEKVRKELKDLQTKMGQVPGPIVAMLASPKYLEKEDPDYVKARATAKSLALKGISIMYTSRTGIRLAIEEGYREAQLEAGELEDFEAKLILLKGEGAVGDTQADIIIEITYQFILKFALTTYSRNGIIAFPAGLGTWDVIMEAVTLIQTEKIPARPIFLMSSSHFKPWVDYFREELALDAKTISIKDLGIFFITENNHGVMTVLDPQGSPSTVNEIFTAKISKMSLPFEYYKSYFRRGFLWALLFDLIVKLSPYDQKTYFVPGLVKVIGEKDARKIYLSYPTKIKFQGPQDIYVYHMSKVQTGLTLWDIRNENNARLEFHRSRPFQQHSNIIPEDTPKPTHKGLEYLQSLLPPTAYKILTSLSILAVLGGLMYVSFFPLSIAFWGPKVTGVLLFGFFVLPLTDLLGQWISGQKIIIKQSLWAFPIGLGMGLLTWAYGDLIAFADHSLFNFLLSIGWFLLFTYIIGGFIQKRTWNLKKAFSPKEFLNLTRFVLLGTGFIVFILWGGSVVISWFFEGTYLSALDSLKQSLNIVGIMAMVRLRGFIYAGMVELIRGRNPEFQQRQTEIYWTLRGHALIRAGLILAFPFLYIIIDAVTTPIYALLHTSIINRKGFLTKDEKLRNNRVYLMIFGITGSAIAKKLIEPFRSKKEKRENLLKERIQLLETQLLEIGERIVLPENPGLKVDPDVVAQQRDYIKEAQPIVQEWVDQNREWLQQYLPDLLQAPKGDHNYHRNLMTAEGQSLGIFFHFFGDKKEDTFRATPKHLHDGKSALLTTFTPGFKEEYFHYEGSEESDRIKIKSKTVKGLEVGKVTAFDQHFGMHRIVDTSGNGILMEIYPIQPKQMQIVKGNYLLNMSTSGGFHNMPLPQDLLEALSRTFILDVYDMDNVLIKTSYMGGGAPKKEPMKKSIATMLSNTPFMNKNTQIAVISAASPEQVDEYVKNRLHYRAQSIFHNMGSFGIEDDLDRELVESIMNTIKEIIKEKKLEGHHELVDKKKLVSLYGFTEDIHRSIGEELMERLDDDYQLFIQTSKVGLQIFKHGKEEALKRLAQRMAEQHSVSVEEILRNARVIGDSQIDAGMLNLVARNGGVAIWVGAMPDPSVVELDERVYIIGGYTQSTEEVLRAHQDLTPRNTNPMFRRYV